MDALSGLFKKDPKLVEVLGAPTLSVSDKQQIVQELQKNLGSQDKEGIVKNFLATLAENNRLGVLAGVVEKFGVLMGAQRGEVELTVTSATVRSAKTPRDTSLNDMCGGAIRKPLTYDSLSTTEPSAASSPPSTSPTTLPTARSSRSSPRSTQRSRVDSSSRLPTVQSICPSQLRWLR
jgi:hypothetical protein